MAPATSSHQQNALPGGFGDKGQPGPGFVGATPAGLPHGCSPCAGGTPGVLGGGKVRGKNLRTANAHCKGTEKCLCCWRSPLCKTCGLPHQRQDPGAGCKQQQERSITNAWCFFGLHAAASGGGRGFGRGLGLGEGTSLLLFAGAQVIVGPAPCSRGCRLLSPAVTDSLPRGQILLSVLRKSRGCCQNSVSSSSFSGSCGCLAHDSC